MAGVLVHACLLQLATYLVRPTAAYRALELGADPAMLGLVAASFALLPLLVALAVGRWIDSGRGHLALVVGAALMLVGGAGLILASDSLWALLAWNVVIGLGHLFGILGEQNAVAQLGAARIDRTFGHYTFVASAGQAAAPMVMAMIGGGAVIPPTHTLFIVFAIICAALTGVSLALRTGDYAHASPHRSPSLRGALKLGPAARPSMYGGILTSMFILAAIDLVQIYLPALGVERQLPTWVIGTLLTVRAVATMLSRLQLDLLVRTFGRGSLITASTLIGAVCVMLLAIPLDPWWMGALLVVAGATLGIGQPLTMSVISLASPPGSLATWLSLRLSANRFGQSAVPLTLSLFALGSGAGPVFIATGVMLVGAAIISGATLSGRDNSL